MDGEQQEPRAQQGAQQPAADQPQTAAAPATALLVEAGAFVDDLYNAVHYYCADGFDILDSTLREAGGPGLTPEQLAAARQGTSELYLALRGEMDAQLQKFEAYALETCLHVPAGLLVQAQSATDAEGEGGAVSEAQEAAVDEQLSALRTQIAAAKHRGRKLAGEVARYDAALERYSASMAALAGIVPGALGPAGAAGAAGKENAVADNGRALAAAAMALEDACRQLEGLRAQRQQQQGEGRPGSAGGGAAAARDELAAEKEVLRRQAAVRGAPAADLRRLQERLAA